MSRLSNLLTRAVATQQGGPSYKGPRITPALGNLKVQGSSRSRGRGGGKAPEAATLALQFQSPGMPQALDQDAIAFEGQAYAQNLFVMRCIQTMASTISGLPFHAGMDPSEPADYDPMAPLAQLLGPSTPQAPGGPNPTASSRMLWDWSIKQYIIYGRLAWECQLGPTLMPGRGARRNVQEKAIIALWPLVAAYLQPIPTDGGTQMFDGFIYQTSRTRRELSNEQIFYAWKQRHDDWRQSESVLEAARLPINIATGLDKYMARLLQNDMVATTMVVTPPFAEAAGRRAFREQFRARYTGVDQAGGTIFGEAHRATDDTTGNPLVQIERIAQTNVETGHIQVSNQAKIDITIALGVPMSLIGNASQRTYANADSEYKNFWTITVLPLIMDLQEYVNTFLAPRIGQEVGWFDLSHVEALRPPGILAPPMVGDLINFGVADAQQVATLLGIPTAESSLGAEDTSTIDIDVESSTGTSISGGGGGGRSAHRKLYGVTKDQLLSAHNRWAQRRLNTTNLNEQFIAQRWVQREHIDVRRNGVPATPEADRIKAKVEHHRAEVVRKNRLVRAAALAERTEAMAAEARKWAEQLRAAGDELAVSDLDEYLAEAQEELERATWVGLDGEMTDTLTQADVDKVADANKPANSLTTWDGDLDSWLDQNEPLLEQFALAEPDG